MASGRLIGDAYIVIYPQTDQFGPQLEAAVKKYTAAMRPTVKVRPVLDKSATAKIDAELKETTANVNVGANLNPASAAKIREQLDSVTANLPVGAHLDPASAAKIDAQLAAFGQGQILVNARLSPASAASVKTTLDAFLAGDQVLVNARISPEQMVALRTSISVYLGKIPTDISVMVNPAVLEANKERIDRALQVPVPLMTEVSPAALAADRAQVDAVLGRPVEVPVSASAAELTLIRDSVADAVEKVPVTLNDAAAVAELADLKARAAGIRAALDNLQVGIKDAGAKVLLQSIGNRLTAINAALEQAGDSDALDKLGVQLTSLTGSAEKAAAAFGKDFVIPDTAVAATEELTGKTAELAGTLGGASAASEALDRAVVNIGTGASVDPLTAKIRDLASTTAALKLALEDMKADVKTGPAQAAIAALQLQVNKLGSALGAALGGGDMKTGAYTGFLVQLMAVQSGYEKLLEMQGTEDAELVKQAGLFNAVGLAGPGSLIHITDILNASLPEVKLFSGAIGDMYKTLMGGDAQLPSLASHLVNVATSTHLTAEAAIELTAVWAPAIIAVAAFAAAASPTVVTITKQLTNMNTAARGTGQAFQSLATGGASVTAAVKPSVLELFGEALYAVQNRSSTLASAMRTLGAGIDQFGAKAAVAFDSNAASQFFTKGSQDALMLMNSFEQLGSIIGTLMKAVPGYAEVLLGFGNAFLTVGAHAVSAIEPLLADLVKLHGALFYGGLAGTAAGWIFAQVVSGAASASLAVATMAAKVLGDENVITKGALSFGASLEEIGSGPVIAGVALLAGAIAAVVVYMKASNTAALAFNKTIQQSISSASLGNLQSAIQSGLTSTTVQYVAAQKTLSQTLDATANSQQKVVSVGRLGMLQTQDNTNAINTAQGAVRAYGSGLQQLTAQQSNVNANLAELAKTYGTSIPGALSLANGAQVSSNQLTATGAANTATLNAQVGGYVAQLKVMTAGTGTLNQALNALNVTQSSQVTNAQKLAQAYSAWIGIVTGGDAGFTAFEQGFVELNSVMSKNAADAATLYAKTGNLKDKIAEYGATLNGTTQASIAARQAFDSQITAAVTLYGNLQTMAAASGNTATAQVALAKSGKDVVAQLLPLAKGSQEATAEVYALAQVAGYSGADSFQALAKWVGNTKGAEDDLNKQQTILTLSTANLTQAAKNLSTAISQEITQAEAQAIAKTENFSQVTLQLAQAISQSQGAASSSVMTYSGQFYNALIKAGDGAGDAKQQVDAFLNQLGASSATIAQVNAALAKLPDGTQAAVNATKNLNAASQANLNTLRAIPGALATTTSGYNSLFSAIVKEDQGLADNTSQANITKQAFITFAENGLNLTKTAAQQLWNTQNAQNLTSLAGKAGTTESAFIAFAKSGLNLSTTQAQQLWNTLRLQYLDTLVAKGKSAESQFINLAKGGLDLTTSSATQLWNTMKQQYLDTLASKAGETQSAFEKTAGALGDTKGAADKLYTSMHTLAAGSPYGANVNATISASGQVQAIENSSLPAGEKNSILGSLTFNAAGGLVPAGGTPAGRDGKLAVVAPGELIIPTSHAPKFGDMARKASIPGFASGGLVAVEPGVASTISQIPSTAIKDQDPYAQTNIQAFVTAMKNGLVQTLAAAAISLAGVSNASAVAALQSAAAKAGWTGAQWTALENVEMREAGFSLTATNPSSGAYGMAQFIDGPSEYSQYGGNATTAAGQAVAMVNYIKCVPLDGRILTREGWKTYAQVKVGDETVGYDHATGRSAWTKVTAVHYYNDAPVTRLSSNRVDLRSTPNHRWLTEKNIQTGKTSYRREEFTETQHIGTRHRIRLAATHDDLEGLPFSATEAQLLGWIAGDGHVAYPKHSPNSVVASVFQSEAKPEQLAALRVLLENIPHTEYTRPPLDGRAPVHQFRLRTPYARDLFKRSGYEGDLEQLVLGMSSDQRAAFVAGLLEADGHLRDGVWTFCQNEGPVLRAFLLAAYLSGHWCHVTDSAGQKHVRLGSPYVGSGTGFHREELERQPVWCVTTGLGSWTVEQSGQVFLTGNSRYGTPEAAWAHEQQFGWYSGGGVVPGGKGYSAGGMVSEPVFGYGKFSGMPYSFAENGPEQVIPGGSATAQNQGLPGITTFQANTLITLMQQQNKLLAQLPYSQAQAINQAQAAGVRRGYFATSG